MSGGEERDADLGADKIDGSWDETAEKLSSVF